MAPEPFSIAVASIQLLTVIVSLVTALVVLLAAVAFRSRMQ
jgi:hypothetical protein